jgi:ABC-type sulfate transport system permease component
VRAEIVHVELVFLFFFLLLLLFIIARVVLLGEYMSGRSEVEKLANKDKYLASLVFVFFFVVVAELYILLLRTLDGRASTNHSIVDD